MLKCLTSCCWDDVVRQRIPDEISSHWKGSAATGRQSVGRHDWTIRASRVKNLCMKFTRQLHKWTLYCLLSSDVSAVISWTCFTPADLVSSPSSCWCCWCYCCWPVQVANQWWCNTRSRWPWHIRWTNGRQLTAVYTFGMLMQIWVYW